MQKILKGFFTGDSKDKAFANLVQKSLLLISVEEIIISDYYLEDIANNILLFPLGRKCCRGKSMTKWVKLSNGSNHQKQILDYTHFGEYTKPETNPIFYLTTVKKETITYCVFLSISIYLKFPLPFCGKYTYPAVTGIFSAAL